MHIHDEQEAACRPGWQHLQRWSLPFTLLCLGSHGIALHQRLLQVWSLLQHACVEQYPPI